MLFNFEQHNTRHKTSPMQLYIPRFSSRKRTFQDQSPAPACSPSYPHHPGKLDMNQKHHKPNMEHIYNTMYIRPAGYFSILVGFPTLAVLKCTKTKKSNKVSPAWN